MALDIQTKTEDLAKKLGTDATKVKPITKQVEDEELLTEKDKILTGEGTNVEPKLLDTEDRDDFTIQQVVRPPDLGQASDTVTSSIAKIDPMKFEGAKSDFDVANLIGDGRVKQYRRSKHGGDKYLGTTRTDGKLFNEELNLNVDRL